MHFGAQIALAVVDFVDNVAGNLIAAVGEYRVAFGHLQGGGGAGAEGDGKGGRQLVGFEAKAHGVVAGVVHTHRLGNAHRYGVFGTGQRLAQGNHAGVAAVGVFRLPAADVDRRVVDQRCRGHAFGKGGGINEGFEGGTGLADALGGTVEAAAVVVVASDHGADGAGFGVERYQSALDIRLLHNGKAAVFGFGHTDQRADF